MNEWFLLAFGTVCIFFVYAVMIIESKTVQGDPIRVRYGLFAPLMFLFLLPIFFDIVTGDTPAIFWVLQIVVVLDYISFILGDSTPVRAGETLDEWEDQQEQQLLAIQSDRARRQNN